MLDIIENEDNYSLNDIINLIKDNDDNIRKLKIDLYCGKISVSKFIKKIKSIYKDKHNIDFKTELYKEPDDNLNTISLSKNKVHNHKSKKPKRKRR